MQIKINNGKHFPISYFPYLFIMGVVKSQLLLMNILLFYHIYM